MPLIWSLIESAYADAIFDDSAIFNATIVSHTCSSYRSWLEPKWRREYMGWCESVSSTPSCPCHFAHLNSAPKSWAFCLEAKTVRRNILVDLRYPPKKWLVLSYTKTVAMVCLFEVMWRNPHEWNIHKVTYSFLILSTCGITLWHSSCSCGNRCYHPWMSRAQNLTRRLNHIDKGFFIHTRVLNHPNQQWSSVSESSISYVSEERAFSPLIKLHSPNLFISFDIRHLSTETDDCLSHVTSPSRWLGSCMHALLCYCCSCYRHIHPYSSCTHSLTYPQVSTTHCLHVFCIVDRGLLGNVGVSSSALILLALNPLQISAHHHLHLTKILGLLFVVHAFSEHLQSLW